MKKKLKSLFLKKGYVIFLIIIISLLLIAAGYIYYNYSVKHIQTENENDLKTIAELKINQIVQWNKERTADAMIISKDPLFVSALERWLLNKHNKSLTDDIQTRLSVLQKEYGYEQIILSSKNGELLLSAVSDLPVLDKEASSKIVQSVNSGEIEKTDLYYCKIHTQIHYDIITPLFNEKKNFVAAILTRVDPSDYLFPLVQTWPTLSKTAETLLIRKKNDKVIFLNDLKFQKDAALKLEFPLTRKDIPAVQAVLGYKGAMKGNDYRGVKVLSYINNVPGTNWYMISKIDDDEIYSELKFREAIIILILVVLILSLIFGIFWVYHFRQRNIYRDLYNAQEEFKTTLHSIGDAVITTDTIGRIKYINSAAEKLTGWSETDVKGEKLEEIFKIINEGTRNKIENPTRKVLAEGIVVGLVNHTILISKNGLEIPISDSCAPIRDEAGEIIGAVLVFRDQSEERLNHKILNTRLMLHEYALTHSLNELLTKSLDEVGDFTKSPIGFFHFIMPDQETLHLQAWSTETEKIFCKAEGKGLYYKVNEEVIWADAVRQRKPIIHNDSASLMYKKGVSEGDIEVVRELVVPVIRNDKVVAVLGVGNKPSDYTEKDTEFVTFISDVVWEIVDKKKKEQLVIDSEKFLLETQKIALLGSYLLDFQTGNWTSSKILDDIFGIVNDYNKSVEDWTSIIHPEWRQEITNYLDNEVIKLKMPFNKEYKIIRKSDYKERWVHGMGELILNKDDQPVKMIGTIRDITESKIAEQEIKNLNRIYALLSNTNEAIVRIKDRQKLFDKICKISIDDGKFIMAWIGIVNNDSNKVEVKASAGLVENYLENINIDLSDEITCDGPTGKAIIIGKHFTTNDIENDRSMLPWKEGALKLGYKSCASFPINVFGKTIGAFSIYADQKNFFLDHEIRLLDEMATDISFALEFEQTEINRRIMEDDLHASEESFRSLYENSVIGLYRTTPEGKIILANPTLVNMLGYSSFEELATKDLEKENLNAVFNRRKFIQEIELNGEVKEFEDKWIRKDGTIVFIKECAKAIRDLKGKTLYYDGTVEDITAQKQSLEALNESKLFIEGIIDAIPVRVFWKDTNLVYMGCNSMFARDAGFTNQKEIIGKDDYQMVWRNEAELYRADDLKVIESGESKILYEESQTTPEGDQITLLTSKIPLRNSKGECIGLLGTYIDITQLEKAQKEIIEREERYRSVTETANDAIITTDNNGIIVSWNYGAEIIFGYKEAELIGEKLDIIIPPVYLVKHIDGMKHLKQGGEQHVIGKTLELLALHKSGKEFPVELSLSKWETDSKKFYTGIIRDITERKIAEIKIQENEEIFNQLMEHSPVYIFFKDENIRSLRLSKNYEKMLNRRLEDLLGKNMYELFPSDITQEMVAEDKKILYAGELVKVDEKYNDRFYTTIKFPIKIEGKPRYLAGFTIDISDRVLIEEALYDSNEFLERLFSSANVPIIVWDNEFIITRFNPAFEQLTGRIAKNVIGKSLEILFPPEKIESSMKLMQKTKKGESLENVEIDFLHIDGSVRLLLWNSASVLSIDRNLVATIAQGLDITERKKTEEALKKSKKEFQTYFDSNSVGLSVTAFDNSWIEVNQKLCDIFGYTKDELKEHNWLELTHPDDLAENINLFNQALNGEIEKYNLEKRFFRKDGSIIYVSLSTVCQRNDDGSVHHFLTSYNDITERKLAEDAILKSGEKLRALNARLESVKEEERINLSRELHDHLGQNLTGLKMEISYFANKMRTKETFDTDDFLSKAPDIISLIDEMINNVRKISAELRPNVLDYLGLIPAIEWQIDELKKRNEIACVFKSDLVKIDLGVQINSSIFRIVQEAFTNIIRHSGATKVIVSIKEENDLIKLEILDNGKGIKSEDISNIVSLGILGMKERTLQFNGKLHLENSPQGGTLLTLIIPKAM